MPIKPLFTLICDEVRVETSNKLIIIGLYNNVINFQAPTITVQVGMPGQPPATASHTAQFVLPFLTLLRRWEVSVGGRRARTVLIDPSGNSTTIADIELPVPPNNDFYQEVLRINGLLLTPGTYTIRTTYTNNSAEVYDEHFEVRVITTAQPAALELQGPIQ